MTLLTFIIPVRHQENARNWPMLKAKLAQTMASISNQTHDNWRGIVVANVGAELPPMLDNFSITRVTFSPNLVHDRGSATDEDFLDAFRYDKGRRVLSGMLDAKDSKFFMIVDDDDLVSSNLVQYVSDNQARNGWIIERGYLWSDNGQMLLEHDHLNSVCGTSLIIRSDVYRLPPSLEDASIEWIKDTLGSHRRVPAALAAIGHALDVLPFRGAIYRVGNSGSHSGTPSLTKMTFFNRRAVLRPWATLKNLTRLRLLTAMRKREFFGSTR